MSKSTVRIGHYEVGHHQPTFIIAEIGINHNGSLDIAKKLIACAKAVGVDAVKFQKRTPELCVPKDQWHMQRDTPWGRMAYIDYRVRIEFGREAYEQIDQYCKALGILWTASCWDEPSVDFIQQFEPPFYKIASASVTDLPLLEKVHAIGHPVIVSTGMSTLDEIDIAVSLFADAAEQWSPKLLLAHSTSTYPCPLDQVNLRMIASLRQRYPDIPVGYSGHETGLAPTVAAVAMGAAFIERHITLDRAMWGTDQAASVEPGGLQRLVTHIRDIESAYGDGVKHIYESEQEIRRKLRRHSGLQLIVQEDHLRVS